jgi:flagellar biosynthesis protein FlhF
VIIDTEAVAPGDSVAVRGLASELEPLSLDAVYVVLPATLGAQTGRRLLAGLAPLRPTALAISHADETDQLGLAVELASAGRIPVSFLHEGLDIRTALSGTDPFQLASRLLP